MQIVKCRNCGAQLDVSRAVGNVIECEYCHGMHTLAKSTDINAVNFLAMGEHESDNGKFDEAYTAYGKAASIDGGEPEAYFGMALAANKVRYIKDIKNNRLQPICYDATNKSFVSDTNYIKALSLAAAEQKAEYIRRANEIDYIRNEFYKLKQSGKEYDCFICVKVTADGGHKTIDSERANDIYYHLKDKGYRPFYSEREIQNETGADYEARILYALFSSPCMLVVCSDESYLQTPWVKNEYTRFISLINDEQKEANSIAIGFFDTPIERLPGRNGRLQGVCLKNPDAYSKIVDFVDKHYDLNAAAPQISRKTYGQVTYQKKAVVKSQIQKRTLAKFEQTAITVSEQSKLDIAKSMLDSGNFSAVISRCNSILETNKSCALAYWYMFLAENECKNAEDFEKSARQIYSFDNLESAIATGDTALKNECYNALFNRVKSSKLLYIYEEYISLPDSSAEKINELTSLMFDAIVNNTISNDPNVVFEAIIKTVSETDTYIDMNLSFADKIFDDDKEYAAKCYKNVLDVEASNGHALWQLFRINHNLNTATDVVAFLIFKENQNAIESEVFAYGFNRYAVEQMFSACFKNVMTAPQYNVIRFDFIFSLIPQSEKKFYNKYINEVTNSLLVKGQFTAASRYNDIIIAEDKYNDMAYFKRLYIKRKTLNPFEFAKDCDSLYDDPDFSAAIDAYAEKHVGEPNIYIDFVNTCHTLDNKNFDSKEFTTALRKDGLNVNISESYNRVIAVIANKLSNNKSVFAALKNSGYYYVSGTKSVKEWFVEFIKKYVTDEQIEEAKKCYDKEHGDRSYEEMLNTNRLDGGIDRLEGKTFDAKWFNAYADSLFGTLQSVINVVDSGKHLTEENYVNLAHFMFFIEVESYKLYSLLFEKIKEKFGLLDELDIEAHKIYPKKEPPQDYVPLLKAAVTEIPKAAFNRCKLLTHIELPESIEKIGDEAFSGCGGLATVRMGNNVKSIEVSAFENCKALTSITIPDSVEVIGNNAFSGCNRLATVIIGKNVKSIEVSAFENCMALTSITIPDSVEVIGSEAFSGCSGLAAVRMGNNVKSIEASAFENCMALTSIAIPDSVEVVGKKAFCDCKGLSAINVARGVKNIDSFAFYECDRIENVSLSDNLESIGEQAFGRCSKIKNIEIPNSVSFIGDGAFSECSGLTDVTMPKSFKKDRFRIFGNKQAAKHIKFTLLANR